MKTRTAGIKLGLMTLALGVGSAAQAAAPALGVLDRRGVELRILSLLPPRAELQHEIIRRAGLAEVTIYEVEKFPSVIREFQPQLLHAHFATEATAKARELRPGTGYARLGEGEERFNAQEFFIRHYTGKQ